MPRADYSRRADHLLSLLQHDEMHYYEVPSDVLILHGTRCLPVHRFLEDGWYFSQPTELEAVRIGYNPIDIAGHSIGEGETLLTLRKILFGSVRDAGLVELDALIRGLGLRMRVACFMGEWLDDEDELIVHLELPEESEVADLIRLIRLHRQWPLSEQSLATELHAEAAYRWLSARPNHLIVEYGGSRKVPPRFLQDHPFWLGQCVVSVSASDTRHVVVYGLRAMNGAVVLTVKPHAGELYRFLQRHMSVGLRAAAVRVLSDGRRKPVSRLVLAPASAD